MDGHNGLDVKCSVGTPLYFPVDADVEWWSRSYIDDAGGVTLDIHSSKRIKLDKLPAQAGKLARQEYEAHNGMVYVMFRFIHLSEILVKDAKRPSPEDPRPAPNVKLGDLIAKTGNTGASGGPHLHWGMKIVAENSMTLDNNNGYYGALDFTPFQVDRFVNAEAPAPNPVKKKLIEAMLALIKLLEMKRDKLQKELDEKSK